MPGTVVTDILGSQRDLMDNITLVDAKETPLFSMIEKGKEATNMLFEWPVDQNMAPRDNAVVDGKDVDSFENATQAYDTLNNRCQWARRTAMVGKLAQEVQNQAGTGDKLAYAVAKQTLALKRDIEAALCSDNEFQQASGANPSKTRGLGKWFDASNSNISALYRTPSGSIDTTAMASLTESIIQGVLQSIYKQTGQKMTYTALCGPVFKSKFKDFTMTSAGSTNVQASVRVFNENISDKKIMATVDVYEGDFGTLELVPSLFLAYDYSAGATTNADRRCYVLDPSNMKLRLNQAIKVTPLPDQGGGPRKMIDCIFGLQVNSPLKGGKFAATS